MYLDHYGLREFPFSTAPDPRFYYPSAKHREALACLVYTVQQRKGFALISGEVGAGKTMLCRAALNRLDDGAVSAVLSHTSLGPTEFLEAIVAEFGMEPWGKSKAQMLHMLKEFLIDHRKRGRTVVLIVDEAQELSPAVLEEVRLIGNLETDTEKLLQTVLVGQPELRRMVGSYNLRQLDQRIALKFHLGPLSEEDVSAYIDHRMETAGAGNGRIFQPESKPLIFRASRGVPRVVNNVCDQCLLEGFVNDEEVVTAELVEKVIDDRDGYYMDEAVDIVKGVVDPETVRADMRKARLKCPRCSAKVTIYEEDVGRSGKCPGCGTPIRVPDVFSGPVRKMRTKALGEPKEEPSGDEGPGGTEASGDQQQEAFWNSANAG